MVHQFGLHPDKRKLPRLIEIRASEGPLSGVCLIFNVQNLTDKSPPIVLTGPMTWV